MLTWLASARSGRLSGAERPLCSVANVGSKLWPMASGRSSADWLWTEWKVNRLFKVNCFGSSNGVRSLSNIKFPGSVSRKPARVGRRDVEFARMPGPMTPEGVQFAAGF